MAEMKDTVRLLLIVDESSGTRRAVDYVAKLIGRRRGFHVVLMHLLPPMPPELLEFGGAENPRKEQNLQAELRGQQEQWIASRRSAVQPALDQTQKTLRRAGVSSREIDFKFSDPMSGRDGAGAILEVARGQRCHTIVLGHESHSWFRELFGGHLAEELFRRSKGFALWVVE